jgi:hypothetical protein
MLLRTNILSPTPRTPMIRRHRAALAVYLLASLAPCARAQSVPTVDGVRDALYGAPRAIQTVNTSFGENLGELDAGYAFIGNNSLYLMLTGNIENNGNRLEIFIDSKAGGQAVFDSSSNDNSGRMDGTTFDAGFTPDYYITLHRVAGGNPALNIDFANLLAQSASGYTDVLSSTGGNTGAGATGTGVNANPVGVAYDNSNVAGVVSGSTAANQSAAAAVATGIELRISLDDIGYAGGPLNVMAALNNSGHNFFSNQFLSGVTAPQGSLGGDGNGNFTGLAQVNMQNVAGNQFFNAATFDADFNDDHLVDGADFLIWQRGLGGPASPAAGDADNNGAVNASDLALWRTLYGTSSAAPTLQPVPEPPAAMLIAAAAVSAVIAARRRNSSC